MFKSYFDHITSSFNRHPAVQITTLLVLTAAYIVLTGFIIAKKNIDTVMTQWGEKVELKVYLNDSINKSEKLKLKQNSTSLKILKQQNTYLNSQQLKILNNK